MRIAIDIGHNCAPKDTGAVGFGNECQMNRLIGEKLIELLKDAGVETVDVRPRNPPSVKMSLMRRAATANDKDADYYVSIHHNAGGGAGSEIYVLSNSGRKMAEPILKNLVGLGFNNRGIKSKGFYVLKHTKMPAILLEICFVDSKTDVELWNDLGANRIATAIFEGLKEALKF